MATTNTINPFVMTGKIPVEYFCDREKESEQLTREITGMASNVLLMSERRIGKTSLITHCFDTPQIQQNFYTFYFDILHTSSFQEFIYEFQKEVFDRVISKGQKMIMSLLQIIKSVNPKFGIDPVTGTPTLAIELGNITAPEYTLTEIFEYLEKTDKPCIIAIDEFQRITRYPEKNTEALLRSKIQHLTNTHFIFAGSERHLLSQMFGAYNRPFYNSTMTISLERIEQKKYTEYVIRLFNKFNKTIEETDILSLYNFLSGNTFCMQKVLHIAFAATPAESRCDKSTLNNALNEILTDNEHTYRENLSRLPAKQKAVLYAIAIDDIAKQVTSTDFVSRHSLGSASSVQAAIRILLENDWVGVREKEYFIADRFFSIWLKRMSGYKSDI